MAEFNYGINIPQPNTSMFGGGNILQGLATIEQIRGAQAQQALAQQLAPYELQKAQLGIQGMQLQQDATRQGMRFAQAANARAQASEARTVEAATADRKLADALSSGASAEEIFKLLPYASDSMAQKFPQIAQSYISSKLIPVLRGGVIDTEQKKKIVDDAMSVGAVLDPARAKVAQAAIASVPDPVRQNFLPKIFEVANAGYNGNSELALSTLKDYGNGLLKDPKTSALGELVMNAHKNMSGFGDKIPLSAWYAQLKSLSVGMGDPVASDQIDEFSKKFLDISQSEAEANLRQIKAKAEELKLQGGMPADEKFKAEKEMRDTFQSQPLVRAYADRRIAVQAIDDSLKQKNPIADQTAIVQLIKLSDPTSTVSVTEAGQIQTTGLFGTVKTLAEKFNGTGKLNDDQRRQISVLSKTLMNTYQKEFDAFKGQTERIASEAGLKPKNIVAFPTAPLTFEKAKSTQTATEAARGKSVAPPIPTARPAAPPAPVNSGWSDATSTVGKPFKFKQQ